MTEQTPQQPPAGGAGHSGPPAPPEHRDEAAGMAGTDRMEPGGLHPAGFDREAFLTAMASRRSLASSGDAAPDDEELARLLRAVAPVADHAGLRPWRFIALRGDDRKALGRAFDEATGTLSDDPSVYSRRPLRSPLLLALVGAHRPHPKVPEWEQHASAAGAGHLLSLALWAAGWAVHWRTGPLVRSEPVRRLHGLSEDEVLMGWLYIGQPDPQRAGPKPRELDVNAVLSRLPAPQPPLRARD